MQTIVSTRVSNMQSNTTRNNNKIQLGHVNFFGYLGKLYTKVILVGFEDLSADSKFQILIDI
uniref:Uncharacterized protein n=1 Tax=Arundo donax TaxID=35708 RepID=A0A0A9H9C1_ARUDO